MVITQYITFVCHREANKALKCLAVIETFHITDAITVERYSLTLWSQKYIFNLLHAAYLQRNKNMDFFID